MSFITRWGRALLLAAALVVGAVASSVSALDLSCGVISGDYIGTFGGGLFGVRFTQTSSYDGIWINEMVLPYGAYGGGAFFDAQYAEIGLGVVFGGGDMWYREFRSIQGTEVPVSKKNVVAFNFIGLNIGVFGKYPIALNDQITLFPIAGIDYAVMLYQSYWLKEDFGPDAGFGALWLKFGAGFDFCLTEKLFIRPELLYGFRFENSAEKYLVDMVNYDYDEYAESMTGHGLTVKLGMGFKL